MYKFPNEHPYFSSYYFFIFSYLLGLSIFNFNNIPNSLFTSKELGAYILCIFLLFDLSFRITKLQKLCLKINIIDVLTGSYLIILPLLQVAFLQPVHPESLLDGSMCLIIYIWIRYILEYKKLNELVYPFFYSSGLILILNILIIIFQSLGYINVNNSIRGFSGMFFNPAPLSTLIICFLYTLIIFIYKSKITLKSFCFYVVTIVLTLWILIKLDSRTSFLSLSMVSLLIVLLIFRYKILSFIKKRFEISLIIFLFALALTLFLIVFLYDIRPESVKGRFLIWNSTFLMIKENFWSGVGIDRFKIEYSHYQAIFLNKLDTNQNEYAIFADETHYAFNEYLQIIAERGVFGLIILIMILFSCFKISTKKIFCKDEITFNVVFFAILILLVLTSITSYSIQLLPINLLMWLSIGFISSTNTTNSLNINISYKRLQWMVLPIIIFFLFFFTKHLVIRTNSYLMWNQIIEGRKNKELLFTIYQDLKYNSHINRHLGDICYNKGNYLNALSYYNKAAEYSYDIDYFYSIGYCYEALGLYDKAEQQYIKVALCIPKLIKPHYLLAKMYHKIGDEKAFNKKAYEISIFTSKKPNGEFFYMKDYIRNLNNSKN